MTNYAIYFALSTAGNIAEELTLSNWKTSVAVFANILFQYLNFISESLHCYYRSVSFASYTSYL